MRDAGAALQWLLLHGSGGVARRMLLRGMHHTGSPRRTISQSSTATHFVPSRIWVPGRASPQHMSEGIGIERLPGFPNRQATITRWEEMVGRTVRHFTYYELLGVLQILHHHGAHQPAAEALRDHASRKRHGREQPRLGDAGADAARGRWVTAHARAARPATCL
jgi:hypothetical protein